ncbi:hypothetical protein Ddye_022366 [Dipteronia dyeriana]|uniref:PGG domain-containing protein n=1 Tax=Dipteronia dyeriana TaxID=168575 RepID=A0AAD9U3F6_9ROSI|nr:hypothetical protein Ddye_022366 [Dipteronia dyeriana]
MNSVVSNLKYETVLSSNNILEMDSLDFDQLFKAAADGDIEPFKRIDQQQVCFNLITTPIKNTILHINISSEKASMKFMEEILEICPSLLLQVNAQGDTPLHVAAKFEHIAIVDVLIKLARAQRDQESESRIGAVRQMLRMTNNKGNTALHEAMQYKGVRGLVKILVKEDPDFLYSTNNIGETPLYIAAEIGFLQGAIELLKNCSLVAHEGPNGKTALHAAVMINIPDLTRKILQKRESLTKEIDDNGWTPLHYAAYYGYQQVTRTLLEFGKSAAYIGDKYRKMTPLHLATSQGHIDIAKEIILCCPDCYDLVDERGWNVLHFAMASLCRKELSSLLENPLMKRLVKEKDDKGNTPLHVLATCTRSMETLHNSFNSIISEVRVNPSAVNKRNISAANAYNYGYPELKCEIMALSEDNEEGPYVRGILRRKCNYLDEHFKQLKGAKESHLIAAALIATVTFAAAFTLPGGYKNEEGKHQGTAILSRNSAFQAFIITDAIAMVFSTSAVFIYVVMSLDMFKKYINLFELGAWITVVAMGAMVMAFVTGTYAVLAPLWLAIVTCFIGLSFFFFVLPVASRRPTMDSAASSSNIVEGISLGSTTPENNATIHETLDIICPAHHHRFLDAAACGNSQPFNKQIAEQIKLIVTPIKNTVLHINIASEKVSTEFVEDVLGICPSLLVQVNTQGDTPLHVAAKFERIDVVKALIKHARAQHELESGIGAVRQMLRMTNNKGNTALHEAMQNKCIRVVKLLLREDTDFSYPANHCGETPLYIAALTGFYNAVIEMLGIGTSVSHDGPNGKTALHAAVRRNNQGLLTRRIIEKMKNLTKEKDDNGWTPLHCAAYYGRYEVMHILLEFDKSPTYVGDKYRKMTPLHLAASRGYLNMIMDMISQCPDCYELVDDREWNFLHFAMATLNKDELFILLQLPLIKKLLHVKDAKGNTPLHVLAAITPYLTFRLDNIINKVGGDTNAVNQHYVNVAEVFNLGCPNLKQEIIELSKHTGDGPYPQGVIVTKNIHENRILELSGKAKDPHLVVAALILIVTFAAAFTLPGGYRSDEESKNQGTAILSRKSAFQTFVISDAIAMVFSMCAVFSYFIMSLEALPLKKYLTLFIMTPWFVVIAMAAMAIAFVTGTYAVLSPSLGLAIVTCLIGLTVFLLLGRVGYTFVKEN